MSRFSNKVKIATVVIIFSITLGADSLECAEKAKEPKDAYENATAFLADLDLEKAYKWAGTVIKDFPGSKEAEKAILLKAMISTIRLQTFDMLSKKCAEAVRKAAIYDYKKKNRELYIDTTQKTVEEGEALVSDVKLLFKHVGKPMTIEFKKNYDSLTLLKEAYVPYKMLQNGYPPTKKEMEIIVRHQTDMSYCFMLSRLLYGPSPESDEQVARRLEKRQVIKTDVNWAGCMMSIGDWLVHYAPICKVGWIHPILNTRVRDLKKARSGYLTAKRCFQSVIKLIPKTEVYDKSRVRAEERIKEIDKALREIK